MLQCIVGSCGIVLVLFMLRNLEINIVARVFVKVCISAITYFTLQIATKNQIVMELFDNILKKAKAKEGRR